jgi:ketosteroid isomerase-like protein
MATTSTQAASEEATAFVERFIEAWAEPQLDRFMALMRPDVVLEQPMMPRMVGIDAAREGFRRLIEGFPGIRGRVLRWSADGDVVFIEMRLTVPAAGRRPLEWDLTDRIELDDDLVRERITYMDSVPIVLGVLTRPALWPAMARMYLPGRS